jgi:predicted metal-binding protein
MLFIFARHYDASDDGTFADARVLGDLRTKAIARIPG